MDKNRQIRSVTILGSGTSTGIPMLGCKCRVCTSENPKNKRYRTSFLLNTQEDKNILIDTTPDLRSQLLTNKIDRIDSCIITHTHADHVHGIDDLRPLCFGPPKKSIPIYTNEQSINDLTTRFGYIFDKTYYNKNRPVLGGGIPKLHLEKVETNFSVHNIEEVNFRFLELPHGYINTLMLQFDKVAIAVDCNEIPEDVVEKLRNINLELLIIDCVKEGQHSTHLTLDKTIDYIKRINPKKAILVHMGHQLEHNELNDKLIEQLGPHVAAGYDGQIISF